MSDNERRSGFLTSAALAVSLSLAACATHKPATTTPTPPQDTTTAEESQPELPPAFNPPIYTPIKKKQDGTQGGTGAESSTPAQEPPEPHQ